MRKGRRGLFKSFLGWCSGGFAWRQRQVEIKKEFTLPPNCINMKTGKNSMSQEEMDLLYAVCRAGRG